MITQTSNEHLDPLNARAQAIRYQAGQLGDERLPIPRRPYSLRVGDEIQIRHTITHPDHGQLRNRTSARVTRIDSHSHELDLRLANGTEVHLAKRQIADADLRLAYVQHPFPAQDQTTDAAHLIVAQHATRDHETDVLHTVDVARIREQPAELRPDVDTAPLDRDHTTGAQPTHEPALAHTGRGASDEHSLGLEPDADGQTGCNNAQEGAEDRSRRWPRQLGHDLNSKDRAVEIERDESHSWEP